MDALSEVLSAIHLDGAVFLDAEFTAPWCVEAQYGLPQETQLLRGADHIALFHFLLDGSCKTRLADGGDMLTLGPGDFVLYPHDHKHILGSDLGLPVVSTDILPRTEHGAARMTHGGGGAATRFVCGYLACDRRISRALFASLPQMMRIPMGSDPAMSWLTELLRVGVAESQAQRPGARAKLTKLSELIFVEAMRRYAAGLPEEERGWLAGLRDPQVGRALAMLHAQPARAWTVDELAQEVAMSRSALGQRFAELIGEPPMQYLTHWRLALAARALRSGPETVGRVAERYGYESESAFNRAFKREFGMPPASWRRQPAH
jgi:AraC-like DNA-binding protein